MRFRQFTCGVRRSRRLKAMLHSLSAQKLEQFAYHVLRSLFLQKVPGAQTSPFHFSPIRKNIFLWVEECNRLISEIDFRFARDPLARRYTLLTLDNFGWFQIWPLNKLASKTIMILVSTQGDEGGLRSRGDDSRSAAQTRH
jgi:hypothetical protein